jgi:hypothetical protein
LIFEMGEVRIDLRPISSLLPHEETIPAQLEKLTRQIKDEGIQKDPLIVDRESGTILDGMHRVAAFQRLGYQNVVCCLVDYSSRGIELKRWARVYRTGKSGLIRSALEELGFSRQVPLAEAFDSLEDRTAGAAAINASGSWITGKSSGLAGVFRTVRSFDTLAVTMGWQRGFAREDEIDVELQDPDKLVLVVERIGKQDVLEAARTSRLFPCKTSLHTIDPRPVALDFPLQDLDNGTQKSLGAFLAARKTKMLPSGSTYEGRRYKERLILLDKR